LNKQDPHISFVSMFLDYRIEPDFAVWTTIALSIILFNSVQKLVFKVLKNIPYPPGEEFD